MVYMSFKMFCIQVQEIWRRAIMLVNFTNVKKPSAEFSLPRDHVDFEKVYRDQHPSRGRLVQEMMARECTIVTPEEIIKDTDMKCEIVSATQLKKSEHRRKGVKHILTPTWSSRGCTIEMLLKEQ